ncbi:MAG: hypothetical protein ACO3F2_10165 [Roseiflexaceae bacterium]
MRIQTNDELQRAAILFNAGEWRESLLVFEHVWLRVRTNELKAYVQIANAVLQLHMGLISSPRRLLARAAQLLMESPATIGMDVVTLLRSIRQLQAIIPAEVESGEGVLLAPVPPIQLVWHP